MTTAGSQGRRWSAFMASRPEIGRHGIRLAAEKGGWGSVWTLSCRGPVAGIEVLDVS